MDNHVPTVRQAWRVRIIGWLKWIIGVGYLCIGAPGYKSKLVAVVFHEVNDEPSTHARLTNTYSTKRNYLKQISLLQSIFNIIDVRNISNALETKKCLITFDDGYKGSLEAARILDLLRIPSIHFLNLETIHGHSNSSALLHFKSVNSASPVDWSNSTPSNYKRTVEGFSGFETDKLTRFAGPYLSTNELKELKSFKTVTFGDHFLNHWYANSLSNEEVIANLARNAPQYSESQWVESFFAAPHGEISSEKIEIIANEGYKLAFSGRLWTSIGNLQVLPRIDMNNSINSKATLFGSIAIMILRNRLKTKDLGSTDA